MDCSLNTFSDFRPTHTASGSADVFSLFSFDESFTAAHTSSFSTKSTDLLGPRSSTKSSVHLRQSRVAAQSVLASDSDPENSLFGHAAVCYDDFEPQEGSVNDLWWDDQFSPNFSAGSFLQHSESRLPSAQAVFQAAGSAVPDVPSQSSVQSQADRLASQPLQEPEQRQQASETSTSPLEELSPLDRCRAEAAEALRQIEQQRIGSGASSPLTFSNASSFTSSLVRSSFIPQHPQVDPHHSSTSSSASSSSSSSSSSSHSSRRALPTFRDLVRSGRLYDGFLLRPKREYLQRVPECDRVRVSEGIVRAVRDPHNQSGEVAWKIECRVNGVHKKMVDSPTAFASWYQVEVEHRACNASRKPYRELIFINLRDRVLHKSGDNFRRGLGGTRYTNPICYYGMDEESTLAELRDGASLQSCFESSAPVAPSTPSAQPSSPMVASEETFASVGVHDSMSRSENPSPTLAEPAPLCGSKRKRLDHDEEQQQHIKNVLTSSVFPLLKLAKPELCTSTSSSTATTNTHALFADEPTEQLCVYTPHSL
eukprot:CAMPEP_0177667024 /NCGR_PEP_ID=MMETSP0447-20121125/21897_1 /TAXON_ID=0 /ORGANISM="Stygamoeba regulata, Strain BSH-02190019" /LENGTH=538 /DNA_ID=CAMNT_0019173217 /DNA_START=205 /DNA_END=1821 /DNA_ORIENTATION=-